jgi:hypothetical protein
MTTSTGLRALALLCAALFTTAEARAAEPLEILFLGEEAPVRLVVEATATAAGDGQTRSLRYVLQNANSAFSASLSDVSRTAPLRTASVPAAPKGASLSEPGGNLVVTIDDVGTWQAGVASIDQKKPLSAPSVPVLSERTARLELQPVPLEPGASAIVDAALNGSAMRIRGRALVTRGFPTGARAFVTAPPKGAPLVVTPVLVVDVKELCGRPVPVAFTVTLGGDAAASPGRVVARDPPTCLASGAAVFAVDGARVEPRGDTPFTGVLVVRSAGLPSAPARTR